MIGKGAGTVEGFARHNLITAVTTLTDIDPLNRTDFSVSVIGRHIGEPGRPVNAGVVGAFQPNVLVHVVEDKSGAFATVSQSFPSEPIHPEIDYDAAVVAMNAASADIKRTTSRRLSNGSMAVSGTLVAPNGVTRIATIVVTHKSEI